MKKNGDNMATNSILPMVRKTNMLYQKIADKKAE